MPDLSLADIRRILRRHRGSVKEVADSLSVTHATVSLVLKGKSTSARVYAACEAKARKLMEDQK